MWTVFNENVSFIPYNTEEFRLKIEKNLDSRLHKEMQDLTGISVSSRCSCRK